MVPAAPALSEACFSSPFPSIQSAAAVLHATRLRPLRASGLPSGPFPAAVALLAGKGAKNGWPARATVPRPGRKATVVTTRATTTINPADEAVATTGPAAEPTTTGGGMTNRVEALDPRILLVDVNVRDDVRVDRDFIASVHDLGVLVPIVAVRTADGGVRVRFGHRRTRAGVLAGLATVPVVIVADEAATTAGQVERIVTQYAENEHRTGLSLTEQVGVVGQLAAFGVSAAQIAKRTKLTRVRVDAALTVSGSTVARAAVADHDLDLTEAAVVAEFASDPAAVDLLVAAAGSGRFDHVAQRLRDDRTRTARREAFTAALTADGITVVSPGVGVALRDLTTPAGAAVTVDVHVGCAGHAARVDRAWGRVGRVTGLPPTGTTPDTSADDEDEDEEVDLDTEGPEDDDPEDDDPDDDEGEPVDDGTVWAEYPSAVWVCVDPAAHGHLRRPAPATRGEARVKLADMTPAAAEAARATRRDVIDSNKNWGSAATVRRSWVRTLLTRKTAPKGTAALLAAALACDGDVVTRRGGNDLAADLLGVDRAVYGRSPALAALIAPASEARALVLALGVVLAGYEDATHTGSWRTVNPATRRYLTFLADCGYTLADVERRACGQNPLPAADTAAAVDEDVTTA
jgi:ParB family chromosome partitioning protein